MNARSSPWSRYPVRVPEKEAEKLKRRFRAVSRCSFRRQHSHRLRNPDWPVICGIALMLALTGFIAYRWFWNSNLLPSNQARLQASYVRNCASARAIGMTNQTASECITTIGIDLGQNTLHLIGMDARGGLCCAERSRGASCCTAWPTSQSV